jgi:hypothetical protein
MLFSEIKENVMKETGISSKHYEVVISDFWKTVRSILSNPKEVRLGLRFEGYFTFWLNYWRIRGIRDNKFVPDVDFKGTTKEFYADLVEILKPLKKSYRHGKTGNYDE